MTENINDAVYGCLIGGAIGDALGAAVEGWTHESIREEYGTFENFKQYYMPYTNTAPGAVTSDTTLRHVLCLSLVANRGRIGPDEFANVLCAQLNLDRVWINEEITVNKLSAGMDPWQAGRGSIPDSKTTSAITPIGIVNIANPTQAYQDGFTLACVLQDGPHRHASATVAAGVAEALTPDSTVDSVVETIVGHSRGRVSRAIDLALGFAEEADTPEALTDLLYDRFLDWQWPPVRWDREKYHSGEVFSASTLEVLPVAIALLSVCDGDVNESIVAGVNYGRDSDAVATLIGSLAGAIYGAEEIRDEWKSQCESANGEFFEELEGNPDADFQSMANRLVDVLTAEQTRAERRADELSTLLSS
ncbi:ADP-ribosylglycohydrolase family protein (plasmid) [Haloferacaceae archaeon DSL9]